MYKETIPLQLILCHLGTQLREEFDSGGEIIFSEEIAVHDVATLLKEFFRDLPEAIVPKELHAGLLAIQSNFRYATCN